MIINVMAAVAQFTVRGETWDELFTAIEAHLTQLGWDRQVDVRVVAVPESFSMGDAAPSSWVAEVEAVRS